MRPADPGLPSSLPLPFSLRNLLDKLVGEKSRWVTQVQTLEGDLQGLPLASLVTSAFVTYLPMLPEEQRASIQRDWSKMLGLQDYDLCRLVRDSSKTPELPTNMTPELPTWLIFTLHTLPLTLPLPPPPP